MLRTFELPTSSEERERWTRLRCTDGLVHHVDTHAPAGLQLLCTRTPLPLPGRDADFVTCPLCACLWRNVYPPVRYVTRAS
jgi:hypothetical protein